MNDLSSRMAVIGVLGAGACTAVAVASVFGYYWGYCRGYRKLSKTDHKIIEINDLPDGRYSEAETEARRKLAALYRVVDRLGWSQQIYNHISLRVPGEDEHFLINPYGLHYSEITASSLVKVDIQGNIVDPGSTKLGNNLAGYIIHSAVHESRKDIKCVIHVHTPVGTAVSCMKFGLLPISISSVGFGEISYHDFQGGSCDESEKKNLAKDLGPVNNAMILRNHGLLAMGRTVEVAYQVLRDMMEACETQVLALSAGYKNLVNVETKVIEKERTQAAARQAVKSGKGGGGLSPHEADEGEFEFECIMRELDREGYSTGHNYKLGHLMDAEYCPSSL